MANCIGEIVLLNFAMQRATNHFNSCNVYVRQNRIDWHALTLYFEFECIYERVVCTRFSRTAVSTIRPSTTETEIPTVV